MQIMKISHLNRNSDWFTIKFYPTNNFDPLTIGRIRFERIYFLILKNARELYSNFTLFKQLDFSVGRKACRRMANAEIKFV